MTDFEDRLTTALRSAGDDAPEAAGLAPAARRRAGARRRRTALASVAAVVAVAGVFGGAALLGDRDDGASRTPVADALPDAETSAPDRIESWRDLSVTVPADWGHGFLDDWCGEWRRPGLPVVERPGGASIDILCDPQNGYGVQFFDGSAADLAYRAGRSGSTRRATPRPPTPKVPGSATSEAGTRATTSSGWSPPTGPPSRRSSRRSSATRASTPTGARRTPRMPAPTSPRAWCGCAATASTTGSSRASCSPARTPRTPSLRSSPPPAKGDRMCTMALTGPVVQVTSADAQGRVTLDACHGFSWDGAEHDLTAEVLYWGAHARAGAGASRATYRCPRGSGRRGRYGEGRDGPVRGGSVPSFFRGVRGGRRT